MKTECNGIVVELKGEIEPFVPALTCERGEEEGLFYLELSVRADRPAPLPTLHLAWDLPSIDVHYKWNSRCSEKRTLDSGTATFNRITSSANTGMPVYALYNMDGINACTWALSDVVHSTRMGGAYHNGHNFESEVIVRGSNREVLEDMCDVGIDCFQFDQPLAYDLDELADLFRARRRVLWSPVDIQKDFSQTRSRRLCAVRGFATASSEISSQPPPSCLRWHWGQCVPV